MSKYSLFRQIPFFLLKNNACVEQKKENHTSSKVGQAPGVVILSARDAYNKKAFQPHFYAHHLTITHTSV